MIEKHKLYNCKVKNSFCGKEELFNFFRGNKLIHHVTSGNNLLNILNSGEIKYNNGSFDNSYPQSKNCYAKYKKCISLFDIVTPSVKQFIEVIDRWVSIISKNKPAVFINFDLEKISNKLILNNKFRDEATKLKKMRIGYIEALYPDILKISESRNFLIMIDNDFKIYPNTVSGIEELKRSLI